MNLSVLVFITPTPFLNGDQFILQVPLEVIKPLIQCSEPQMKNVAQEILNNIRGAQNIYGIKSSQGDLQQFRAKYPGACEEVPPFGGTGMNICDRCKRSMP
jgi:hypothetical protein